MREEENNPTPEIYFDDIPYFWLSMWGKGDCNYTGKRIEQFVEWVLEQEEISVLGGIPPKETDEGIECRIWYFTQYSFDGVPRGVKQPKQLSEEQKAALVAWQRDNQWYLKYLDYWRETDAKATEARRHEVLRREEYLESIEKPLNKLNNKLEKAQQKGDSETAGRIERAIQALKDERPMDEVNAIVAGKAEQGRTETSTAKKKIAFLRG